MKLSKKTLCLVVLSLLLVALPLSGAFAADSSQQTAPPQQGYTNPWYYQYNPNYQPNYNYGYNGYGWGMGHMGMGMGMGCW